MLKKLAISAAAGAIVLASATAAFAWDGWSGTHNWADVTTSVNSQSNSGGNAMGVAGNGNKGISGNGVTVDSNMQTGNSTTNTLVVTGANTNLGETHGYTHNGAEVSTGVTSFSNSGNNGMGAGGNGNSFAGGNGVAWDSNMHTGNSTTNTAVVIVVNTNLSL